MTIGELAAESGMAASTFRYWERIGVLPKPVRISGQRRYAADAIRWLTLLRLGRSAGSGWVKCVVCCTGSAPASGSRANGKQQVLDEQITQLKAMRRVVDHVPRCRCVELAECGRIARSVVKVTR